jgi:HAD superfamily hydrolase (TIGR01509 family)
MLIIFDLDGVLIDSKDIHYDCLNTAIMKVAGENFVITRHEHETQFDAKPTAIKLKMLSEQKGLDSRLYQDISSLKQLLTIQHFDTISPDIELIELFNSIKQSDIKIACASNSVYETVKIALLRLGIMSQIDYFISNEDVSKGKPHPEMYFRCMSRFDSSNKNTIIVEDSVIGLTAARKTGATVIHVKSRKCVTKKLIFETVKKIHQF